MPPGSPSEAPATHLSQATRMQGRCSGGEDSFQSGACQLDFSGDGLISTSDPQHSLWLSQLIFHFSGWSTPRQRGCATLLRHPAGSLYVTDCEFLGSGDNVRAVQASEGSRMYMASAPLQLIFNHDVKSTDSSWCVCSKESTENPL
jgi:hypothetical protein